MVAAKGEEDEVVRLTHRYLLVCCRAIWTLLPLEASRQGVEVAERYIEGRVTREEFARAEWQAEGAAFYLDPFEWPPVEEEAIETKMARRQYEADKRARIELLVRGVEAIPVAELRRMVRATAGADDVPPN